MCPRRVNVEMQNMRHPSSHITGRASKAHHFRAARPVVRYTKQSSVRGVCICTWYASNSNTEQWREWVTARVAQYAFALTPAWYRDGVDPSCSNWLRFLNNPRGMHDVITGRPLKANCEFGHGGVV
jgi:hypothetical protein